MHAISSVHKDNRGKSEGSSDGQEDYLRSLSGGSAWSIWIAEEQIWWAVSCPLSRLFTESDMSFDVKKSHIWTRVDTPWLVVARATKESVENGYWREPSVGRLADHEARPLLQGPRWHSYIQSRGKEDMVFKQYCLFWRSMLCQPKRHDLVYLNYVHVSLLRHHIASMILCPSPNILGIFPTHICPDWPEICGSDGRGSAKMWWKTLLFAADVKIWSILVHKEFVIYNYLSLRNREHRLFLV